MELFDNKTKKILEYANRFRRAGESDVARDICYKCIIGLANVKGRDLLETFYGASVYNYLETEADAAVYIMILQCLKNLYSIIEYKDSWVDVTALRCDLNMKDFFEWLSKPNKKPTQEDVGYIRKALKLLTNSKGVRYLMSSYIKNKNFPLILIIEKIVSGEITISSNGELV